MTIDDLVSEFCANGKDAYFLVGTRDDGLDLAARLCETGKFCARTVEGGHLGTKAAIFSLFRVVLLFSRCFQRDWDTFNKCIRDAVKKDQEEGNVVIIIVEFQGVLRNKTADFRIFCDSLRECGARVVMQCASDVAGSTLQRVIAAGWDDVHQVMIDTQPSW